VLHAVLRNPARGSRSAAGSIADAASRAVFPVPALARSFTRALDSLQRSAIALLSGHVRGLLHRARLLRAAACGGNLRSSGPTVPDPLLRVLLAHAVLHETRTCEGTAGAADARVITRDSLEPAATPRGCHPRACERVE